MEGKCCKHMIPESTDAESAAVQPPSYPMAASLPESFWLIDTSCREQMSIDPFQASKWAWVPSVHGNARNGAAADSFCQGLELSRGR